MWGSAYRAVPVTRYSGNQLVFGALRIYLLDFVVLYVSAQAGHLHGGIRAV